MCNGSRRSKSEIHRSLAFRIAHEALKTASGKARKVQDWEDIERADKMARRAAGLEAEGTGETVSVHLQLVKQRILAHQEPPDCPEALF